MTGIITGTTRPEPPGAWTATLAFGYRALLKIRHVPEQLFDVIAIPVVFTLMFTYLLGGALAGSPARYLPFLLPGTLVMAVLLVSMYAGTGLNTDVAKGITGRYCASVASSAAAPSDTVATAISDRLAASTASTTASSGASPATTPHAHSRMQ